MPDTKTYKVGEDTYDIPLDKEKDFLNKYPKASEVESYIVGKDTFDLPKEKVSSFLEKYPDAKPLKKKGSSILLDSSQGQDQAQKTGFEPPSVLESTGQENTSKSAGSDTQGFHTVKEFGQQEPKGEIHAEKFDQSDNPINKQVLPHNEIREKIHEKVHEKPRSVEEFNSDFGIKPEENDHKNPQMIMQPDEQEDMLGKVQSKRYVQQQSQKSNIKPENSHWLGLLYGIDEETSKTLRELAGGYSILHKAISGITKDKSEGITGTLSKTFNEMADKVDETVKNAQEKYQVPDDFWGIVSEAVGSNAIALPLMMVSPGTKLKYIEAATGGVVKSIPGIANYLGVTNALETYNTLDKQNAPEAKKIGQTVKEFALGEGTGLLWDGFGYISNETGEMVKGLTNSNIAKVASRATMNGSLFAVPTALDQYATDKVSSKEAITNFITGAVFGLAGGEKTPDEAIKAKQEQATNNLFTTSTEDIKKINDHPFPVSELRMKQIDLQEQADKETDPKKKEQLQLAANSVDGYIDIKAVTKQIVSDPVKAKKLINENGLLSDDEKTYYSKKVDDIVAQNDPRIKASQPALKEIDKANNDIQAINENQNIPPQTKPVLQEGLEGKKKELVKQVNENMSQPNDIYSQNKLENERFKQLQSDEELLKKGGQNAIQERSAEEMGTHEGGDKGARGKEKSEGMGQKIEGEKTPEESEKLDEYIPKEPEVSKEVLDEIKKLPLTHVKEKGMDLGKSEGTYLSTEKENRNAKTEDRIYQAQANVEKPFVIDNPDDFVKEVEKRKIPQVDENGEDRDARDVRNDLYNQLKKEGYDAVYYREGKTQEGELYVFDKNKVKLTNKEENIEKHNQLVDKLRIYKGLVNKKQKAEYEQNLRKRASGLGYKVTHDKNKNLVILDEKNNPIRQITEKRSKEVLSKEKSLSEHPQDFQDFVRHMTNDFNNISQVVGISNNEQALRDIESGTKSAAANDMFKSLKDIYDSKNVKLYTDETRKAKVEVPIEELDKGFKEIDKKSESFIGMDENSDEFWNKLAQETNESVNTLKNEGQGTEKGSTDNEESVPEEKSKRDQRKTKLQESLKEHLAGLSNVQWLEGKERIDAINHLAGVIKNLAELGEIKLEEGIEKALKYIKDKYGISVPDDVKNELNNKIVHDDIIEKDKKTTGINRAIIKGEGGKIEMVYDDPNEYEKVAKDIEESRIDPYKIAYHLANSDDPATARDLLALKYNKQRIISATDNCIEDFNKAQKENDIGAMQTARDKLAWLYDARSELDQAVGRAGSHEWHKMGLALQGVVNVDGDYSISTIGQRYNVMTMGKKLEPNSDLVKMAQEHERINKELKDALENEKKLSQEKDEKISKLEAEREFRKQQAEIRKSKRAQDVKKLDTDYEDLVRQAKVITYGQLSAGVDPRIIGIVSKMAINRISKGVKNLEQVVDEIYQSLDEKLTKRQIRDAFSGYKQSEQKPSKDELTLQLNRLKREASLTSKLEDLQQGIKPEKRQIRRIERSEKEKQLIRQIKQEMFARGFDYNEKGHVESYKRRISKDIETLQEKLDKKDYSKIERRKPVITPEINELMGKRADLQDKIEREFAKIEYSNRTKLQRILDFAVRFGRAMKLLSLNVYGKLGMAAMIRNITTPIEMVLGEGWSHVPGYRRLGKASPIEAHFSIKALGAMYSREFSKAVLKESVQIFYKGKTKADIQFGKKDYKPKANLDYIMYTHAPLKNPVKEGHMALAKQLLYEHSIRNGINVSDPVIWSSIQQQAYDYGMRSILMNSNKAVQVFKSGLRTLEMSKEGDNISGKILGAFTRTNFPIVRVPSNLVSETFNYTFGLPRGLIEMGIRNISQLFYKKGIEDISPEAADRLFRALKKGAVGTVLGIIGYTSADMIGGYYNPMDKKKTGDVKWGSMRIGDWDAPLWMLHSPPMETLQFYATLRKVHDYYNSKREDNSPLVYDIPTGLKRSSIGLIEQTPFMQEPVDVVKMFAERDQADIWAAEYVNGMLNPQISQQIARSTDKDPLTWESFWKEEPIKRKATGVKETLEKNVPGLRETLPTEEEANRKVKIDKFIKEYSQDKVLDKSSIRNFANVKIDLNDAQDKYDKILKDKDKDLALEQVEASGIGDKIEFLSKNKPLLDRFEKILSFYNKMELEEKYDYKIAVEDQLDEISDAYYSGDKIKLSKDIEKIESLIAQGEKERTQEKNYISKELK